MLRGGLGRLFLSTLSLSGEAWEPWGGLGNAWECLPKPPKPPRSIHQPPRQFDDEFKQNLVLVSSLLEEDFRTDMEAKVERLTT